MNKELYVIITAGGIGHRMWGNVAKQFLKIGDKPIIKLKNFARKIKP